MQTTLEKPSSADSKPADDQALKRIPPLWPLEHFVAVNPFLGFSHQPFAEASATLRRTLGHAPLQPPAAYLKSGKTGGSRMKI